MRSDSTSDVVTAALAEFAAMRSEIDELGRSQRTTINLNISAAAAVFAFVLSERADQRLLLVVPLISAALGLLYQAYTVHARNLGDYIDQQIRPVVVEHTGEDRLLGWERHVRTALHRQRHSQLVMRLAYILLIPAIPAVSLVWVVPYLNTVWLWLGWTAGTVLFLVQILVWYRDMRTFLWI
ncbi:hypothetical protein [Catellatospora sp. NPDC049609]|uniref:hypothetical protein n=1 Tax=Catellatospora sp. NPDC049609 TaxID=3155505 RepID=UPI0034140187